jgi:hypothetical protein
VVLGEREVDGRPGRGKDSNVDHKMTRRERKGDLVDEEGCILTV